MQEKSNTIFENIIIWKSQNLEKWFVGMRKGKSLSSVFIKSSRSWIWNQYLPKIKWKSCGSHLSHPPIPPPIPIVLFKFWFWANGFHKASRLEIEGRIMDQWLLTLLFLVSSPNVSFSRMYHGHLEKHRFSKHSFHQAFPNNLFDSDNVHYQASTIPFWKCCYNEIVQS